MHVFIDTNILLNFFHFSKDELDLLNGIFVSHEQGKVVVHLTEQVLDEFKRNRESKIIDALKQFKDNGKLTVKLPSFMKEYPEYKDIQDLNQNLQKQLDLIKSKADKAIKSFDLAADKLIDDILQSNKEDIRETTKDHFDEAYRRMLIGNPPGKKGSVGDSINWTILLKSVEDCKDLHIISADGDFYSKLYAELPDPFLAKEWEEKKKSKLFVYRDLSSFTKKHFDGIAFAYDSNKEDLIDKLNKSGCFSTTHGLIAELESYNYFSLKELEAILDAAEGNSQFGWIITDYDILDFIKRISAPHINNIKNESHKDLLNKVNLAQKEREEN